MSKKEQDDQIVPSPEGFSKNLDRHIDYQTLAKEAEGHADWKAAAQWYSLAMEQRSAQLALISRLQENFSSKLKMQEIYDLTGDSLRDTFNAQVVMISQYDPLTNQVFHHYAIENGQHLQIPGWHPIDSSRLEIVKTGKPFMINGDEIVRVLEAGKMKIIPGTELPKSWLGVPILIQEQVIGIISLQNLDKENAFSSSDIDLLSTLTNSLSLILENARLLTDMQKRLAHVAALQETNKAILTTLDLNALLNLIIQQAAGLLQAEGGILNLVDWEAQADEVFACFGTASGTLGIKVPLKLSLSGWVALNNKPEISNRLFNDARAYDPGKFTAFMKPITNAAIAPFTIKDRVSGTLVVIDKLGGVVEFNQDDLDLLVGFVNQAAIAIDNAQLYQKAQTLAVAEERSRLARELHDAVTQTLFSASLIAEAVPSAWEKDPNQGRELLQELRGLSRGALAEMRTLLLELRPASLLETQLEELLRQLGEAASGREGIPVDVIVEGKASLPTEVHIAMYRIAQEALNNVVKHSRASHVIIDLRYSREEGSEKNQEDKYGVWLAVKDDGRGFDVDQTPHHHLGLKIMQERAQAIGAKFSVDTHPGKGTQVNVTWKQGGIHE
ncbi:MAG: GAF domain-containing sensor histidine kinase [Bacteroidales bacterium]|nr:GAF domain-containing sensor histidine kinase [Bacteroidales bacterium]